MKIKFSKVPGAEYQCYYLIPALFVTVFGDFWEYKYAVRLSWLNYCITLCWSKQ